MPLVYAGVCNCKMLMPLLLLLPLRQVAKRFGRRAFLMISFVYSGKEEKESLNERERDFEKEVEKPTESL